MKWWPEECVPGDMIRVGIGAIYHYGIFVSEDEIIQFGPPPVSLINRDEGNITVCSTDIAGFSCGNIVERGVLDRRESRKRLSPKKTVALARSRMGEGGYNLLHNNCEHFVYECVFGEKKSTQEDEARQRWLNRPIMEVYLAKIPEELPSVPNLCPERAAEIEHTGDEALKKAKMLDWQLLLYGADRAFGLTPEEISFQKSAGGKWTCEQFHFSLSHTDGAVAVAVSNSPVGVDLENRVTFSQKTYGKGSWLQKMLKRICTPGEAAKAGTEDFLPLWVKKESIFKCRGKAGFPEKIHTEKYPAEAYVFSDDPELVLGVCGEKLSGLKVYRYENGTARGITSQVRPWEE